MALNDSPQDIGRAMEQLRRRIERLERPTSIALGQWVVSQSQYGDLVADNINTGERFTLAAYDKSKKTGPIIGHDERWNQ